MQRVRAFRHLAIAICAQLLAGCGGASSDEAPTAQLVDSAGVTIITHGAAPFPDTIPTTPVLSIGTEGDPDYEFFRLRQISPLASGNIVVANGGTSELLFYDSGGTFLRRAGQPGEGPAEFGFLTTVYTGAGDTLVVMDPRRRRLVMFDSAGAFVRGESFAEDLTSAPPEGMCVFPGLLGVLADGARLTRGWGCMQFEGGDGLRPTMMTVDLVRGSTRDTLGTFNSNTVWERGGAEAGPDMYSLLPLGAVMSWAVGKDRAYLSEGSQYEAKVFDSIGRLAAIYREDDQPPAVTSSDRDEYRRSRVEAGNELPDDVPFPDVLAGYERLVLSYEGQLWAQWAAPPSEDHLRWTVWSEDGMTREHLVLPDVRIEAVRDRRAYGYVVNDLGIQTVVVLDVTGR